MNHPITISVFISSTFRDMHAERDYLVRSVFPRLNSQLRDYNIHVDPVDLRWGVTSEENSTEACLQLIDESGPFFICMLGGRYGWIPDGQVRSITEQEIIYATYGDDPSCPVPFFYFRDSQSQESIPVELQSDFIEPSEDSRQKLEDLKSEIQHKGFPICDYTAVWDEAGAQFHQLDEFAEQVFVDLYQAITNYYDLDNVEEIGEYEYDSRLREAFIAEKVRHYVPDANVIGILKALNLPYSLQLSNNNTIEQSKQSTESTSSPENPKVSSDHESPQQNRLLKFLRRVKSWLKRESSSSSVSKTDDYWRKVAGASTSVSSHCLSIVGKRGSGKTALLAYLATVLEQEENFTVLSYFPDAINDTPDLDDMLYDFRYQLGDQDLDFEQPNNEREMIIAVAKLLDKLPRKTTIVFIIDDLHDITTHYLLDKMRKELRQLNPSKRIVYICSGESVTSCKQWQINPIPDTGRQTIIQRQLALYGKKLDAEQMSYLCQKEDAGLHGYLFAALNELRTLGSYDQMTQIIHDLPTNIDALYQWILQRLETEVVIDADVQPSGSTIVVTALTLLFLTKHGLTMLALTQLLTTDSDSDSRIYAGLATMFQILRPYLRIYDRHYTIADESLKEAVKQRYSHNVKTIETLYGQLADHFINNIRRAGSEPIKSRLSKEVVYSLDGAGRIEELITILSQIYRKKSEDNIQRVHPFDTVGSILHNFTLPVERWHPKKSTVVSHTRNYDDVNQFPCCGRHVIGDTLGLQFMAGGCQASNSNSSSYPEFLKAREKALDLVVSLTRSYFEEVAGAFLK